MTLRSGSCSTPTLATLGLLNQSEDRGSGRDHEISFDLS